MTFSQAKKALAELDYGLVRDNRGGVLYHTYPVGSGSIGNFHNLQQVEKYIHQVTENRKMQSN